LPPFANFACFAALRETRLSVHGLIHRFKPLGRMALGCQTHVKTLFREALRRKAGNQLACRDPEARDLTAPRPPCDQWSRNPWRAQSFALHHPPPKSVALSILTAN